MLLSGVLVSGERLSFIFFNIKNTIFGPTLFIIVCVSQRYSRVSIIYRAGVAASSVRYFLLEHSLLLLYIRETLPTLIEPVGKPDTLVLTHAHYGSSRRKAIVTFHYNESRIGPFFFFLSLLFSHRLFTCNNRSRLLTRSAGTRFVVRILDIFFFISICFDSLLCLVVYKNEVEDLDLLLLMMMKKLFL